MKPRIYIVGGIPGAGKTTVSGLLARRFERGVHIESDELQRFIVRGGLWPADEPEEEATRQLHMRARNGTLLADSYFAEGFTVVIDAVVIGSHLTDYKRYITGRPLHFVLLLPRPEVVEQRDASRPRKHVFDRYGYLDAAARNETPREGLWLDASELTAEETVEEILRRDAESRL